MATYEKRSNGWRAKVRRNGVSESKTFPSKSQAQAWASEREREINELALGCLPRKTVRETLARYLQNESPKKRGYQWESRRIQSWMGEINPKTGEPSILALPWLEEQAATLSTEDLSVWRDKRLKRVAPGTVLREMNLMGAILETARREWGWLPKNPMRDVRRPSQPEPRTRRLTQSEIDMLCLTLGWDNQPVQTKTQEVAAAFLLAIETAMRQGEILGLTWKHVDFTQRIAHLPRTKNNTARDVPLSPRALEILKLMQGRDTHKVFTVSSMSCSDLFIQGKTRVMIEGLHFHDTRREATSRLAKKVDVLTLARITGHKDLRMLMTYYQTNMSEVARQLGEAG